MKADMHNGKPRPRNFVEHLRSLANERPQDVWLTVVGSKDGQPVERSFSYRDFEHRVRALAAQLQRCLAKGERVLVMMDNDEHYAASMLACFYAGVIAVPVPPLESTKPRQMERQIGIVKDCGALCILSTGAVIITLREAANPLGNLIYVAADEVQISGADAWVVHAPADDDVAFLQYTSGSTSAPKGVMVTHANLMANEAAIQERMTIGAQDKFVSWAPLYHDMGLIGGLLQPLFSAIPLVLTSPHYFLERPVRWLELISRHRATVSGGPDFSYRLLLERVKSVQLEQLDLSSWRVAYTGAEPIRVDTETDFCERFAPAGFVPSAVYACYGLAESTLFATGGERGDGLVVGTFDTHELSKGRVAPLEEGTRLVGCGPSAPGHEVQIRNQETGEACARAEVGEIWVSGPSVALGYWGKQSETAETFVHKEQARWLRTGDLGFFHEGQLYVAGRVKDLIIVRGHNLYPQDLERAIENEVDAVRKGRVAAFSVDGPQGEGIGVAVEVSRSMQKLVSPHMLVEAMGEAVSEIAGEALAVAVLLQPGSLPKTTSGKLQRRACRSLWKERSDDAYAIYENGAFTKGGFPAIIHSNAEPSPLDEIETALAELWCAVLANANGMAFGRESHFFISGGNSLTATRVAARIASRWGIDFPVGMMFEHPRLGQSAAVVRDRIEEGDAGNERQTITPLPRVQGQPLPLSHAQERQWVLWQLDPLSAAYNIGGALQMHGHLDIGALSGALDNLVSRHEALRTKFRVDESGTPEQLLLEPQGVCLALVDLRSEPVDKRNSRAMEEAHRIKAEAFDLTKGGLLRVALIRITDETQWLVVAMHHIISDSASMQLLIEELVADYSARRQGRRSPTPPPSIQYADYAAWHRKWLGSGENEKQAAWWRAQLGNADPVLELYTDRPRKAHANYTARRHAVELPDELTLRLRGRSQAENVTLFTSMLAGLQVLLHRYSGQQEIRVGATMANRNRLEFEGIIGLFVNTVVLRNSIQGRSSLARVLAQASSAVIGAQAHQDLPFDHLVQLLQPKRSLSHHPLFQVMFNYLFEDRSALERLEGLDVQAQELPDLQAQFELVLEVRETLQGSVRVDLIYASELFNEQTIERMASHYLAILEAVAKDTSVAVGEVPLLTGIEHSELKKWSTNEASHPAGEPVHITIARQALQQPQSVALAFGDDTVSFADLNRRANRLASHIIRLGVRPEMRVGVFMERSIELVVTLLAILKTGAAYVPLDPDYPAQRLADVLADSGCHLLLVHAPTRSAARSLQGAELAVVDMDDPAIASAADSDPEVKVRADNLAYVIYTSGSTGRPKGVAVRHDALHNCMAWMQKTYGLSGSDVVLHKAAFGFDVSVWEIFWPLTSGAKLVVANPGDHRDPARIVSLILRHGVTTLNFVPSMLQAFLAHPGVEASTKLRYIICGGEAMPAESQREALQRLKGASLQNLYGPTETTIHVTQWTCLDDGQNLVPIGRPISQTQTYVLDAELNCVPRGVAGELYIGGLSLARGYLHRPGLTAERFVADPFGSGGRLYRTGDLVRWNAEGQIEYLGRLDHQVKIRGLRIELGEIEAQILMQPEVREAVVVVKPIRGSAALIAYVSADPNRIDQPFDPLLLRERLGQVLPDYMVPRHFVEMDSLPLTDNGKVARNLLPDPEQQLRASNYEAPQGKVANSLAAIWAEVLRVPEVGRHDNFFDLGGHSLLVIRAQRLLADRLQIEVPLVELFRHPTVDSLARAIERGDWVRDASQQSSLDERTLRQRSAMIQRRKTMERVN